MKANLNYLTLLILLITGPLFAQTKDNDPTMIQKIREEGLNHSKAMETAFYLTDVVGPRLSGSPGLKHAQDWAVNQLKTWGMDSSKLEPWGKFGRGWELQKNYAAITAPYYHQLISIPKAWSASTNGPISGDVVLIRADTVTDLDKYKGQLQGKIVIIDVPSKITKEYNTPQATRRTDEELAQMEATIPRPVAAQQPIAQMTPEQRADAMAKSAALMAKNRPLMLIRSGISRLLMTEKPGLILSQANGSFGNINVTSGSVTPMVFAESAINNFPPELLTSGEDYQLILRLLKAGIAVHLDAEIQARFLTDDTQGYNVVAEIKGTDPKLKDQLVMLGGHLDSWHPATGATDNGAGAAAMMEAMRILKAVNFKPRRTIRMVLWSAEEQGDQGSRNYVANHFADRRTMELKPDYAKVSAYYNLDYGPGKIRGIFLQGNEAAFPIFKTWLAPFKDLGASTVTRNNIEATDHISFDAVGIPGFQFIQDWLDYKYAHHSNQDTYDKLSEDDLKQAATIVAAIVYDTAQSDEMIPRKEQPKPLPPMRTMPNGNGGVVILE